MSDVSKPEKGETGGRVGRPRIHHEPRRKVAWVLSERVLGRLESTVPAGQRSAFLEAALDAALDEVAGEMSRYRFPAKKEE